MSDRKVLFLTIAFLGLLAYFAWVVIGPPSGRHLQAEESTQRASLPQTDYVKCVAFSPDGKTLASGSCDKTVKLWDVAAELSGRK